MQLHMMKSSKSKTKLKKAVYYETKKKRKDLKRKYEEEKASPVVEDWLKVNLPIESDLYRQYSRSDIQLYIKRIKHEIPVVKESKLLREYDIENMIRKYEGFMQKLFESNRMKMYSCFEQWISNHIHPSVGVIDIMYVSDVLDLIPKSDLLRSYDTEILFKECMASKFNVYSMEDDSGRSYYAGFRVSLES